MPDPIRTLIVDDEPLAVERLQILCARIADVSLVGTATNGASALRLIKALKPDLVLLDIQMAGLNGIAVAQALAEHETPPALIFVTAYDHFAVAAFDVAAFTMSARPTPRQ
jgi:two-component system response regulator AlgR